MDKKELKRVVEDLYKSEDNKKRMDACKNGVEGAAFLKEFGYSISPSELEEFVYSTYGKMLSDNDLFSVAGGYNDDEIVEKINQFYSFLPKEMTDKVIEALATYGRKAAKDLCLKFSKTIEKFKDVAKLFD